MITEDVLKDLVFADAYVDDVIIGSSGDTEESLLVNHNRDLRATLDTLEKASMVADPGKAQLFVREVEFCGHVLREGKRFPAPGKVPPIQKWELPPTLTMLRGFLGLCNYCDEYVPDYAKLAWKIMEKLKVKGPRAKAGSNPHSHGLLRKWRPSTNSSKPSLLASRYIRLNLIVLFNSGRTPTTQTLALCWNRHGRPGCQSAASAEN